MVKINISFHIPQDLYDILLSIGIHFFMRMVYNNT